VTEICEAVTCVTSALFFFFFTFPFQKWYLVRASHKREFTVANSNIYSTDISMHIEHTLHNGNTFMFCETKYADHQMVLTDHFPSTFCTRSVKNSRHDTFFCYKLLQYIRPYCTEYMRQFSFAKWCNMCAITERTEGIFKVGVKRARVKMSAEK
jgi:hypothetical protein